MNRIKRELYHIHRNAISQFLEQHHMIILLQVFSLFIILLLLLFRLALVWLLSVDSTITSFSSLSPKSSSMPLLSSNCSKKLAIILLLCSLRDGTSSSESPESKSLFRLAKETPVLLDRDSFLSLSVSK